MVKQNNSGSIIIKLNMFHIRSLKTRVTLFTLAIFVAGIWLLSFYAGRMLHGDIAHQLGQQQLATTSLLAAQIDDDLNERLAVLKVVAETLGGSNLNDASSIQALLENRPLFIRYFNAGVYAAGPDGRAIASLPYASERAGIDYSDRDYIAIPLRQGKAKIGQPVVGKVVASAVLGIGVPIMNKQGKVIGVLAGVTDLAKPSFLDKVTENRYGKSGYFELQASKSGLIITSTGKRRVMQRSEQGVGLALSAGDKTLVTTNALGESMLTSARRISVADWLLVASLPMAEAFASVYSMERRIVLVTILLTIVAGGLTWWMLRRELSPMFATVKQLASLSGADQQLRPLMIDSRNEIGELVGSFNALLEVLGQREDALRDSEFRWKFAIEGSGDGLWDWNVSANQIFFSKTWKHLLGYAEAEIDGNLAEWERHIHPEDKARVLARLQDHLDGKTPAYVSEHRALCKDGSYKWILDHGLVVSRNADNKPLRVIGTLSDIAGRKAAEIRLRMLSTAIEQSPTSVVITNLDASIEYVNPCFTEATGYSLAEALGKNPRVLQSGLTDPSVYADMWTTLTNGRTWVGEFINKRKNGEIYFEEAHISPVTDIDGAVSHYVAVKVDITARKLAEDNLRIAAAVFQSQEGMIVADADSTILRVNSAFTAITGYSAEDVVGSTPKVLSSGMHDKVFYETMWEVISQTGTWEGEVWNRRKDGEAYLEHLIITAVKNDAGKVTNYVATMTDITSSKQASEEIHNLAFYDPLTQLPNRRLLLDRLKQALAASERNSRHGALLFLDLDHFKTLNDTLGHDMGDQLLKQVSARLAGCVRKVDTVARIGGDEFVVLLENLSSHPLEAAAQTETIATKIQVAIGRPFNIGSHEHHSTCSIGATLFVNQEQAGVEAILKQADIAMYQSKDSGRNAIRFFDQDMQDAVTARANLEHELRMALVQKQFQLYFQPQVDHAGCILGAEVLLRWHHPQQGIILPGNFINLAEETGLILPMGQWVLDTACAQLKKWQQDPHTKQLTLSVNVSAKQFRQTDFVDHVQSVISHYAINPALLKLELTESILFKDINGMISTMRALREIGIRFELDDFGTGYSSLQYLKKLPLSQLKIDQSFVRDITIDSNDRTLVLTIITMAHSLGLEVIAEGVETGPQFEFLKDHGCDHYQGYLFGRPVPLHEFETMLPQS
ncbi:EAL domain-containing protein [Methylotenera sp. G11]|uniref:EAL domain-containing protein n=1 Tax=Methylotenera sp. G11 TaxID=1506585 RepID=UPI0006920485|nr:EAL domain-containing protein [Methylotenera sp. G11]